MTWWMYVRSAAKSPSRCGVATQMKWTSANSAASAISAPSSLAIEIAKAAGLRLVSFCRETGHVDYGTA